MIYLIGYMGAGKTTIGKKLANEMQIPFLDTDIEIEKKEKKSVTEIFKANGEHYFRTLETKIIKEIKEKSIIACGGGIPIYNDNMAILNSNGISIYLSATAEFLTKRLVNEKNRRPLISNISNNNLVDYIQNDLKKRESYYKLANYSINICKKNNQCILREINTLLGAF